LLLMHEYRGNWRRELVIVLQLVAFLNRDKGCALVRDDGQSRC